MSKRLAYKRIGKFKNIKSFAKIKLEGQFLSVKSLKGNLLRVNSMRVKVLCDSFRKLEQNNV